MKSVLREATDAGYSHVYVTDARYDSTASNVWGFLRTPAWSIQEGVVEPATETQPEKLRSSFLLEVDELVKVPR